MTVPPPSVTSEAAVAMAFVGCEGSSEVVGQQATFILCPSTNTSFPGSLTFPLLITDQLMGAL